jgi:DNA-binding transcriptional ArsR family regulator
VESQADVFGAISAASRREILRMLAHGEKPVSEIAGSFDISMSAVSQHLSVLREAGLVSQRKQGKQRVYSLNPEPLRAVADWLDFYQPFWTDRLGQLGRHLEENP